LGNSGKVVEPGLHVRQDLGTLRVETAVQLVDILAFREKSQERFQATHLRFTATLAAFGTPACRAPTLGFFTSSVPHFGQLLGV
jgi:hypothetical protein